ncbi:MAG: TolC family protein [Limnohabitans sp.]
MFVLACLWLQPSQALLLEQALEESAASYPSVAARRGDVRSQQAELDGAQWQRFPNLSVSGGSDGYGKPYTIARLEQPVWMWGRIDATIEAAQARLESSQADLESTRLDVMLKTASAFAEGLRAQARAEVAALNVAEHERLFHMIERRVQGEITSTSDATLASARLQQSVTERIQFDNQVINAGATLSQLMGRQVRVNELVRPTFGSLGFRTLEEAQDAAKDYAPSIKRAQAEEVAARATLTARRANALPQIVARVEQQAGSISIPKQSTYLALQYQPGAGLSGISNIAAGQAKLDAARASQDLALMDLLDRVRSDWNDMASLQAQLGYIKTLVSSTTEVKDSYLRQYTVGRKTWIEVLNAQREAAQALYALADTESTLLLVNARLQLYTGYKKLGEPSKKD